MNITIIGTGFVGVVTASVLSSFGHQVTGLDIDPKKVASLKKSQVPFYEPNLENLLQEQQKTQRLTFTTDYKTAISQAEAIFIAVGTPSAPDGQADLKFVMAAAESLAPHLKTKAIVVIKSTVPPGTLEKVEAVIKKHTKTKFYMASAPEFLREGSAVEDTLHPDRVVLGASDQFVFDQLEKIHQPFDAPVIKVTPESAQMAKYAANAYLATRITFINQIADLCQKNGADVDEVIKSIGMDKRIGHHYWYPGFGYGGSCFPKDVKELAAYSRSIGEGNNLFNKINELNDDRIPRLMDQFGHQVADWPGKTVAVLGLSFKPNTDDMREAPSIKVIQYLVDHQAKIRAFDPKSLEVAPHFIPENEAITYHQTIPEAVKNADVIIALIEWPEIIAFDFATAKRKGKKQWFIDSRNQFNPQMIQQAGYIYLGLGKTV